MITDDFVRKIDIARVRLSECETAEKVDKIFLELGITDYPSKNALLRCCMGMEKKQDNTANDEAVYSAYLTILLTGKWRDNDQIKELAIPGSNILDKADKKQAIENIEPSENEEVCRELSVPKKDYNHLNKFYNENILPRMKKKYMSQLISVVEDMINEKCREQQKAIAHNDVSEIRKTERYTINLIELMSERKLKDHSMRTIFFTNSAAIFYNADIDIKTIHISIAHELGHLLSFHKIIPHEDTEKYANLFAYIAINGEKNLYASGHSSGFYKNEMEIIEHIKAISSKKGD